MTQGFWPEQLKEWGCRFTKVRGKLRERQVEVGDTRSLVLDSLEFGTQPVEDVEQAADSKSGLHGREEIWRYKFGCRRIEKYTE